ncbi:hypothetical protein EDD36DRAFT_468014 [Exophiala viscosa]|uniref:Transmembrane protein n=1 Tax=Exophiala viscosa TaxID=2486360 RepID=A0AAN6DP22_9EURO|nr:hypothetical protein EDD36DRAFT_468014 [Exophiala viscosa]
MALVERQLEQIPSVSSIGLHNPGSSSSFGLVRVESASAAYAVRHSIYSNIRPRGSIKLKERHRAVRFQEEPAPNIIHETMAPIYLHPRSYAPSIIRRSAANYLDWPLWAQILLPVLAVTLWVPAYFVVELVKDFSCFRSRED